MAKTDPYTINKQLEEILGDVRKARKLSQVDVAHSLGKPQSFVSKYETGERKLTVGDFMQVCEALGVKPNKILDKLR